MATIEPEWVTELSSPSKLGTKLPVMYTAPENMRSADRDGPIFEPVLVSIGPFHHGKFPVMEHHKIRILSSMLRRQGKSLMEIIPAVMTVEEKAREYYSKSFPEIDFVKMMVYDGCFLLEIFRMHASRYREDDPVFKARWMLPAIAQDIVKLENQLPYLVLNELYERTKLPGEPALNHLAGTFLNSLRPGLNKLEMEDDPSRHHTHLLSLFYPASVFNQNLHRIPISEEKNRLNSFPSVTDLCLSGIKVVKKKQGNLQEIKFKNGVLEIPTLVIDHSTKILMRNLVAYEQCDETVPNIFTSYVTFMDALVNSVEDVEVLRVAGVINHSMKNNEEVVVALNNLAADLECDMNEGYLSDLNEYIYRAYYSPWPQFKADLKRLISSREGMGYVITIVSVYLAALQTVFTVLSYVVPRES